jgi:hypothetical protein
LRENFVCTNAGTDNARIHAFHHSVDANSARHNWDRSTVSIIELAGFFVSFLGTEARISAANPPQGVATFREAPQHPIHYLQRYDSLEKKLSVVFRKAFGSDLIVHRNAGKEVPLYCGDRPKLKEGEDRVSEQYVTELEKLPLLHEQGDGMRSFVGVLLHALIVKHSILLIDEPEAFLHPPQARLLGQMLTKESPKGRQLFVGTHSGDFLRGILDSNTRNVRVIRLNRVGNTNHVRELKNVDIQALWSDPLLRYSNVLDGLFHQMVVVCEGDADCRFYGAILDAVYESKPDATKPDIMFIHCGGKGRIPVVVKALRGLGVPTAVVADFDVLQEEQDLSRIVESLGGNWSTIEHDWRLTKNAIGAKKPELSGLDVREKITEVMAAVSSEPLSKLVQEKIKAIVKSSSPWGYAKSIGTGFVPNGDPTQACNRLLCSLRKSGLFVVECGELESFAKSVGRHGPAWVNAVMQKNLVQDPELEDARHFVTDILSFGQLTEETKNDVPPQA